VILHEKSRQWRLERDLSSFLSYTYCEEALDQPTSFLVDAIIRRNGDFVAVVDRDRFLRLGDRGALLENLALERDPLGSGNRDGGT
jgi:hypothetical protein